VKNKVSPPFRQAEFDIMYGKGISREGAVLDMAVEMGIAKKSGAWFTYDGEQLGQGRENAKQFLSANTDVMVQMADRVRRQSMPVVEPEIAKVNSVDNLGDKIDKTDTVPKIEKTEVLATAKPASAKPAAEKASKKAFTAKDDQPIQL
jgi:recombination protein RecA